jgi:hypothetical protein
MEVLLHPVVGVMDVLDVLLKILQLAALLRGAHRAEGGLDHLCTLLKRARDLLRRSGGCACGVHCGGC